MSLQNSQEIADVKMFIAKGTDGVGIEKIEKTSSSGLVDTYTITYTDGNISTFEVTNGSGGSAGTTTYDNTVSGLTGDTVQEAIDEIVENTEVAEYRETLVAGNTRIVIRDFNLQNVGGVQTDNKYGSSCEYLIVDVYTEDFGLTASNIIASDTDPDNPLLGSNYALYIYFPAQIANVDILVLLRKAKV